MIHCGLPAPNAPIARGWQIGTEQTGIHNTEDEMGDTKLVALTDEQLDTINRALSYVKSDALMSSTLLACEDAKRALYYTRDPVEMANGILSREYEQAISRIADEIKAKIADLNDDEITDDESLDTWLHETIDSHEFVIYTHRNFQVLRCSSNDAAYADDFGEEGLVKDGNVNWPALTYCAMLADVREELEDVQELFDAREEAESERDAQDETEPKPEQPSA